jgi:hypothetical protein
MVRQGKRSQGGVGLDTFSTQDHMGSDDSRPRAPPTGQSLEAMSQEKSWKVLPTEEKTSTHYSVPSLGALEYVSEKKNQDN